MSKDIKMAKMIEASHRDSLAPSHPSEFLKRCSPRHKQEMKADEELVKELVKERDEWKEAAEHNYNLYNALMSTIAEKEDTLTAESKAHKEDVVALLEGFAQLMLSARNAPNEATRLACFESSFKKFTREAEKARATLKLGEG